MREPRYHASDHDGTLLHIGANVAVHDAIQHRGIVARLKNVHGHDFARVDTSTGDHFDIETDELILAPQCPECHGEGGRHGYTPGSRMPDPQTDEPCDACEGTGLIGVV